MNEVRKENQKFRDEIGHLEIELAMPPIPAADDFIDFDLIPSNRLSDNTRGTYARIKCTWIGAFPIFFSALEWGISDWNGEVYYHIDQNGTRLALGAAFAAELATFDTRELYTISQNTFERLRCYYIETGLMVADGEEPFTDAGKRLARRYRIADVGKGKISLVKGELSGKTTSLNQLELDDDIQF